MIAAGERFPDPGTPDMSVLAERKQLAYLLTTRKQVCHLLTTRKQVRHLLTTRKH